jgi:hypothetical protein
LGDGAYPASELADVPTTTQSLNEPGFLAGLDRSVTKVLEHRQLEHIIAVVILDEPRRLLDQAPDDSVELPGRLPLPAATKLPKDDGGRLLVIEAMSVNVYAVEVTQALQGSQTVLIQHKDRVRTAVAVPLDCKGEAELEGHVEPIPDRDVMDRGAAALDQLKDPVAAIG